MLSSKFFIKTLYISIRLFLGGLFIYSGGMKLMNIDLFADSLVAYSLFPDLLIFPVSIIVPALEVVVGGSIIVDIRGALAVYGILILSFSGVLMFAISQGLDMDCGCFGPAEGPMSEPGGLLRALSRNGFILLAVLSLYILRIRNRFLPLPPGMIMDRFFAHFTKKTD